MYTAFTYGLKCGYPVVAGCIPVSFPFGLMTVSGGLPVWMAVFLSMSSLVSAGQFAGTSLILTDAGIL